VAKSMQAQIKRLEKKLKAIAEKEIPKAVAAALNKAHRPSKSQVAKAVAQEEKLPASAINKQIFFNPASARKAVAQVRSFTRGINAIRLISASTIAKSMGTGTNKRGVKVRGRDYKGAFINRVQKNGSILVFQRRGKARTPLEVIRVPIEQSLKKNQLPIIKAKHLERFSKLYQHELSYRLSKYVK
jgi:Prophage minor tail protein Z (GPZ)